MLLRFEIIGVNSQSQKNRGEITISKQNRGKNAGEAGCARGGGCKPRGVLDADGEKWFWVVAPFVRAPTKKFWSEGLLALEKYVVLYF